MIPILSILYIMTIDTMLYSSKPSRTMEYQIRSRYSTAHHHLLPNHRQIQALRTLASLPKLTLSFPPPFHPIMLSPIPNIHLPPLPPSIITNLFLPPTQPPPLTPPPPPPPIPQYLPPYLLHSMYTIVRKEYKEVVSR